MADHTHIEWTDATWNPITGCSVVSAGCKHCYAMKLAGTRLQHHPSRAGLTVNTKAGPVWNGQVRFNEQWLDQPLRWKRPRRIFVCAHGDLFHENVPDQWIDAVFAVMALANQHTFQVLTKRPARMLAYLAAHHTEVSVDPSRSRMAGLMVATSRAHGDPLPMNAWIDLYDNTDHWREQQGKVRRTAGWPLRHVWLGVSVEDQATANDRIPLLLQTPAAVRWVSAEPLLGPVDLTARDYLREHRDQDGNVMHGLARLDWVVAGGESGTGARPMHPDWARSLRDQCAAAGVPFLFKQWGGWRAPLEGEDYDTSMGRAQRVPCYIVAPAGTVHCFENGDWTAGGQVMRQVGKKAAGRLLDGVQHDGYPEVTK